MSGGAFGYKEFYLDQLHDAMHAYMDDPDICEETKGYIKKLMLDTQLLHKRVKKLDYYLSGDSMEYK